MDLITDLQPEQHHERGLALLGSGHGAEAFEHLSQAYLSRPENPRFKSSYALALGRVRGEYAGAVELGQSAARMDLQNPHVFLNLARIYLVCGYRWEAIRSLRRVLKICPESPEALAELARLGVRRPPVMPFLPRQHLANRWMGRLRSILKPHSAWAPRAI